MKALVLGGNGFIGSNIVTKLQAQAVQVMVGSRKNNPLNNMHAILLQEMLQIEDWLLVLNNLGFEAGDVVVNSVGILRERPNESYDKIHNLAAKALAQACARLDIRLIHISAIGLTTMAKSKFIRSKFEGEQAVLASGAQAIIVRPSLLDGEGGYGAKWFRRVATWPIQFVMRSQGLVAPLQVTDLGEAVANLCAMNFDNLPKIIELGGNEILTIPQYLNQLRLSTKRKPALQIAMPKWLVRIVSHIFDGLAWTPLSFGHFELMQGYNVPAKNSLPALLGRRPSEIGARVEGEAEWRWAGSILGK
jgi:NADH dehydrogenase